MNNLPITYRLKKPSDDPFIYSTWLSSEKHNTYASLTPSPIYQRDQTNKITYLLTKALTMVAVLDKNDNEPEDTLLSFLTYQYKNDTLIIHYAFTKSPFRQNQIMQTMLSLVNPSLPIVLACKPEKSILNHLQQNHNIFYDHFYYQRNFYNV